MQIPLRIAAVLIFVCLLVGFLLGRQVGPDSGGPRAVPSSSRAVMSPSPTPSESPSDPPLTVPTRVVIPQSAEGSCEGGDATALLFAREDTTWVCQGEAVGETVRFTFDEAVAIAGLRVYGGSVNVDEVGRHVTGIRWRFDDAAWFEQGVADADGATQEVTFPEVRATTVTLQIIATGQRRADVPDATALTRVEFLGFG